MHGMRLEVNLYLLKKTFICDDFFLLYFFILVFKVVPQD